MKRLLVLSILVPLLGTVAMASPSSFGVSGASLQSKGSPIPEVNVTVVYAGAGTGSTSPGLGSQLMVIGDPINVSAIPDPGSFFGGWVVNVGGADVLAANIYSFSATVPDQDTVLTATFGTSGFTLTTDIDGDGSVDPPPGSYAFTTGLPVTITATANPPAAFNHWRDDSGGNFGTDNPLTVTMNADAMRIAVFRIPITGSILINNALSTTTSPDVTLALTWGGGEGTGPTRMRFSDDGAHWTAWETLKATRAYTLPGPDGYKTVRVQYRDSLGNNSPVFSDYIRLDSTPPTGTIIINNGASTTASRSVSLGLTWTDGAGSGVGRMRFSDDGAHWTAWETLKHTRAYMLPLPNGYHTVRVQYRDLAGNTSIVYNDYIKLAMP